MKDIVLFLLIFISSCANQPRTVEFNGNRLVVENGMDIQKAQEIVSDFLAQEKRFHIQGKIYISIFEYKYQKRCREYPEALAIFKEFCNAQYYIFHSSDPYCRGSVRVIENCENEKCNYKFSEYTEVCE